MDNNKIQYEKELYRQEIQSNITTIKGLNICLLVLIIFWLLTKVGFFIVDYKAISYTLLLNVLMCIPVWIIWFSKQFTHKAIKYYLLFVSCFMAASAAGLLAFHAVLLYVLPSLLAVQYRNKMLLWYSYAMNVVMLACSAVWGYFHGLCDLNLFFESNYSREQYYANIVNGYLTLPVRSSHDTVIVILLYGVLPRAIILLLYNILLRFTIISNYGDAIRIAELTYRKEIDMATGLYNKNKYEEMIENFYPKVPKVAVIFWDLNNLKEINDELGHAAGDEFIRMMANQLQTHFSDGCKGYRIGGDEFVMIVENPESNIVSDIIENVRIDLKNVLEESNMQASSAVGFAVGAGCDILEIVKQADACMYEDKKNNRVLGG